MIISLLQVIWKIGLLSPSGLFRLIFTIYKEGINLMVLVRLAEKRFGNQIAIVTDTESITYNQLARNCEVASIYLKDNRHLSSGKKCSYFKQKSSSFCSFYFCCFPLRN
ncbi:hypothetical protein MKY09_16295 [Psychrobacillus sp. FSL K6-4046]|uniref:hypothetical protein n=1 Tax=Psychrobacillus sp. FSL K6-4046 TaxID=2921550 RepID=UPI00315AF75C